MTKEKALALYSRYIIDGVRQELTPAQMLDSVSDRPQEAFSADAGSGTIIDETAEVGLNPFAFDISRIDDYLGMVLSEKRTVPMAFCDAYSKGKVAGALLDALWQKGSFKLGDLCLDLRWEWDDNAPGSMAAFYLSVSSVSDYIDSLGVKVGSYGCTSAIEGNSFDAWVSLRDIPDEDDVFDTPYRTQNPLLTDSRAVPSSMVADPASWLIYVPFDTADYRFGGSLLSQALGRSGGVSLQIGDADYFMDCYEVVRELVEDGILLSAATVGEGGLLAAVKRMCSGNVGAVADISDILNSVSQKDPVRILFAEVPGVVLQIRDMDFDYVDAEFLLQDVAFYPLGHPVPGTDELRVKSSAKSGIQKILESLIVNQCGEGED